MNRRTFLRRLGITVAAAPFAGSVLAETGAAAEDGPVPELGSEPAPATSPARAPKPASWHSTGPAVDLGHVPVGTVLPWASEGYAPPLGYLVCAGGRYDPDEFPELARVIGAAYGPGRLPDLRGSTPFEHDLRWLAAELTGPAPVGRHSGHASAGIATSIAGTDHRHSITGPAPCYVIRAR